MDALEIRNMAGAVFLGQRFVHTRVSVKGKRQNRRDFRIGIDGQFYGDFVARRKILEIERLLGVSFLFIIGLEKHVDIPYLTRTDVLDGDVSIRHFSQGIQEVDACIARLKHDV